MGIGERPEEGLFDKLRGLVGDDTMSNPRVKTLLDELGLNLPTDKAFCPNCFKVEARAEGIAKADTSKWVYVCSCRFRFTLPRKPDGDEV